MKRKAAAFLLICVMALSFASPAVAATVPTVAAEPINAATEQEITPFFEETRNYFRIYGGVLQFRVWGITSARWLTPWTNV
ncbi:MAG: hypothetical protein FWC70_02865 [Defluviitaleaceae bacterium]|nr:hypothetical protein [Defluviitaleaceae bacterium]